MGSSYCDGVLLVEMFFPNYSDSCLGYDIGHIPIWGDDRILSGSMINCHFLSVCERYYYRGNHHIFQSNIPKTSIETVPKLWGILNN